ncbi:MAG: nucleoside hydrolase [Propionicimonas sp.]|uniref:nucleoside hydrolase n=1 Tax=Propionicimonas sp. TaxID=1955623 RepID=UPI002B21EDB9|nr:nucleoside hydrolase [Propionicimonas sp.]MEA4942923.1 nucleoside hydrolase [Propionicimonas sp.]MEA5052173.1 nucleoside hydrolase [Propionicimonas sp.]
MSCPVIIDTDTAQDDCVTILWGLLDPAADLRAITMVAGNVSFEQQVANAHLTLNVAGRLGEVPIHAGCRQPMLREWASAEDVHGDGSGGLRMDLSQTALDPEHGVDALLRITAEAPGQVHIVAIGPLTNIATACVLDRGFAKRVRSLSIMGGSINGHGNITAAAEYNIYVDPEAAQIVLTAGFEDLRLLTWDPVTLRDATINRAGYDRLAAIGTPLARFFKAVCDTTLDFNEEVGVDGSTHPDSMTLATLLHPELVQRQAAYRVDVETASPLTRGATVMAWPKFGLEPNATVYQAVDGPGFFALLEDFLRVETAPNLPIAGL